MIVRIVDEHTKHADREALAAWLHLSEMTIRRHCRDDVVGTDSATGRVLYDADRVADRMEGVLGRPHRVGQRLGTRPSVIPDRRS